jgi:hypothetical protein
MNEEIVPAAHWVFTPKAFGACYLKIGYANKMEFVGFAHKLGSMHIEDDGHFLSI